VASIKTYIENVEALLEKFVQPNDENHSLALQRETKFGEKLDRWLKNATARRNSLLKILEYYRRPTDWEAEIPAAQYNELKQDDVKQITAALLVPAASVDRDLIAEDHPETVASTPD
jgi:hypothetical protein